MRTLTSLTLLCLSCTTAWANPNQLTVSPASCQLHSARARQQLLVTGLFAENAEQADLTRQASFESLAPSVALVTATGMVVPNGFGRTEIVVRVGKLEAKVAVNVSGVGEADPVDFRTEVVAALSQAGCSSGACHGSPQGKNGFRLSLRGFEPEFDFDSLTHIDMGRRVIPLAPDESMILHKGLATLPHQGGRRFERTAAAYQTLRTWINQGCRPSSSGKGLARLEILPNARRLPSTHPQQQLVALAHYTDGTTRDITPLAVFTSSHPDSASVTDDGLVTFHTTSEVTILVRYLDLIRGVQLSYIDHDPNFVFSSPPEANSIDRFIFAKQRDLQLLPAPVINDATFLRRVFMDVTGTLPTADRAKSFLASTDPQKRAKLIDELLETDEYAAFWAMKWADVMRGSDVTISRRGVHSFHRYLVQSFHDDKPFTQFARETLTSVGNTLHNPPANFHRVTRTPEDAAEAMAELFLGVRIQCAKCHNHPFEAILQNDYYGLAAFFARVKFKGSQMGRDDEIVYLDRRGEVRHPSRNENVAPALFGQPVSNLPPEADRRVALADWLTQADNPYFARATVNRLWFHLFGRGIVEPVDDFRDTNPPSHPELLDSLAADFIAQGYRLKPILRQILNSHTYQLGPNPPTAQSAKAAQPDRYFTHTAVRMHSAEQTLDAISHAIGVPATFTGYPRGTRAIELANGAVDHPFLNAFSKPVRDVICECAREDEPSLNRVIHLLNNPDILSNISSPSSHISRWLSAKHTDAEIIDLLYLTTLSRHPTPSEITLLTSYLTTRPTSFHDLQHALLISNEFLLRH